MVQGGSRGRREERTGSGGNRGRREERRGRRGEQSQTGEDFKGGAETFAAAACRFEEMTGAGKGDLVDSAGR